VFRKNNGKTEVLLGLRLNNPGKGRWSFPGGGVEGKEKLITAGIREFREEVGVQLYGRYITKIGVYKIHNFLFDWETQIIETTQNIDPKSIDSCYGEFAVLKWVDLDDIDNFRLHRWVLEVINIYQSGHMKCYALKSETSKPKASRQRTG
jgi:8-oxo-dGTP pyrophosphatase MutT (NUDIX family)